MSRKPPLRLPDATLAAHEQARQDGAPGYFDPPTGLFVMTEDTLRARGTCCGSQCRHCPYDWRAVPQWRMNR